MPNDTIPPPEPVRTPLPEGALMGMLAIMDEYARAHAAAVTAEKDARIKVLEDALRGLDEAYCRAGSPLTKAERHEDRMRLIAARAALGDKTPNLSLSD